jgi:hypothetical protein
MLPDHDLLEIRAGTLKLKGTTDGTRFVTIVLDRHSHLSDQLKVLRESSSRTVCKTRVREQHTTDDANRKEKVGIDEQRESTEKTMECRRRVGFGDTRGLLSGEEFGWRKGGWA